jgi:hypothetical protein
MNARVRKNSVDIGRPSGTSRTINDLRVVARAERTQLRDFLVNAMPFRRIVGARVRHARRTEKQCARVPSHARASDTGSNLFR